MANSEINWEQIKDEFNKFWISSPMREDRRATVDRFFQTRSQDARYFKDARPRYYVVVRNLAKDREEATLFKVDINEVIDCMNRHLGDVPLSEKNYFIETLQKHGISTQSGGQYSLAVQVATDLKVREDGVKQVHIKENVQEMLALHKTAVEELTEAIRFTAEYLGPDKLPAIEGWDWYDALVKYAPEKARQFKVIDPVEKALPYRMVLINERTRDETSKYAQVMINKGGLADVIEEVTGLNDKGRAEFLTNLELNGYASYLASPKTIKHHSVIAVVHGWFCLDDKGVLKKEEESK